MIMPFVFFFIIYMLFIFVIAGIVYWAINHANEKQQ